MKENYPTQFLEILIMLNLQETAIVSLKMQLYHVQHHLKSVNIVIFPPPSACAFKNFSQSKKKNQI